MNDYAVIDLARLPPPDVLQLLEYEAEVSALLADFQGRYPDYSAILESDPVMKLLEAMAYRLVLRVAEWNDGARGLMLAYASGTTLDHLAALMNVSRLTVTPADDTSDPPTPAVMETDDALRARAQLAWEGLSTAGPAGAYQFHAREADGRVRDVAVDSPTPGDVVVTVLGHDGDGAAPPDLVAAVEARLAADDVRPLTDRVTVRSATVTPYVVEATLWLYAGPASAPVLSAAEAAVAETVARLHALGHDVSR
ncbi:baseplate assembly protein, partial [Roseospira goensis]